MPGALDGVWTGVRDQFEGAFGGLTNPQSRITGNTFGSFTVSGEWISNAEPALTVASESPLYLRTSTYDVYTGRGFGRSKPTTRRTVAPGDPLFSGATAGAAERGRGLRVGGITIEMHRTVGRNLFTAGAPARSLRADRRPRAGRPVLGGIESANPIGSARGIGCPWRSVARPRRSSGRPAPDYPAEVRDLYLDTTGITIRCGRSPGGHAGCAATRTSRRRPGELPRTPTTASKSSTKAPSRRATRISSTSSSSTRRSAPGTASITPPTMVMLARSLGILRRVAVGFAPGERQEGGREDTFLVREAQAHAWAEVYFPGYGWQIFEATKTINPQFSRATGDPANVLPPRGGGRDPLLDFELDPSCATG